MSDGNCGFPKRTWWERNGSWVVGAAGLVAAALVAYGVATGTAGERMAAHEKRIEQVEVRQADSDKTIREVRDALNSIGTNIAVTGEALKGVETRLGRVETNLDDALAGARRIQ